MYAPAGGPFTYMPYLLLDQPLAVAMGINLYGYNKRVACISSKDGAFVVRGDLGEVRTNFYGYGLPGTVDKITAIASITVENSLTRAHHLFPAGMLRRRLATAGSARRQS